MNTFNFWATLRWRVVRLGSSLVLRSAPSAEPLNFALAPLFHAIAATTGTLTPSQMCGQLKMPSSA